MVRRCQILGLLFLLVAFGSGCATIIQGSTQEIPVTSSPTGATVSVDGSLRFQTPTKLQLTRKEPHRIEISLEGYHPEIIELRSVSSAATAGNILIGGLVGYAIDQSSGAAFRLVPEVIEVSLRPKDSEPKKTEQGASTSGPKQEPSSVTSEAERKQQADEASKAGQPQVIAKLPQPSFPSRPIVLPAVAELPKYKVGDSWTILYPDGQTATHRVRAVEEGQYVFEWGSNLLRYYDQNLFLRKQTAPQDGKEIGSALLNQRDIEFPLSANKTWNFRILREEIKGSWRGREARSRWLIVNFKVLGSETIQTPAGAFGAFKIERSSRIVVCPYSSQCDDAAPPSLVRHLWYAPETRSVIKIKHVSGVSTQDSEPEYELVAFDLK
jgi:PEGA domain